jgi:hypothetical protein
MAPHNLIEAVLERAYMPRPAELHGSRDVIQWTAWVQLIEKPEPLLRIRQRKNVEHMSLLFEKPLDKLAFLQIAFLRLFGRCHYLALLSSLCSMALLSLSAR